METFEAHYESMCATLAKCMPGADMDLINRAVEYADTKHQHQKRKEKSDSFFHGRIPFGFEKYTDIIAQNPIHVKSFA